MFPNRFEAGKLLSDELASYKEKDAIILAIPNGGIPIGSVIAKQLKMTLEVISINKINHPFNEKCVIGAIGFDKNIYEKRKGLTIKNKIVIIVDDGIETVNTILATAQLVYKEAPEEIIIAVPVAPYSSIIKLYESRYINQIICLMQPENFQSISFYYEDFPEVSDKDVIELLDLINSPHMMYHT